MKRLKEEVKIYVEKLNKVSLSDFEPIYTMYHIDKLIEECASCQKWQTQRYL